MKYLYALVVLLMALFLAAFITQNSQAIVLKYFYWQTMPLPLSIFMIFAFIGGYALAWVLLFSSGVRHRVRASGAEREARRLREEVQSIKMEKGQGNDVSGENTAASGKNRVPFENDIEEDGYTTVKFPNRAEEGEETSGGEEEKGES